MTPFTAAEMENPYQAARARARSIDNGDYKPEAPNLSNPAHADNSLAYRLGGLLRDMGTHPVSRVAGSAAAVPFNYGPWIGGAAGGAGGMLLGHGLGKLWNAWEDDDEDRTPMTAIAGGVLGTGLGALLGGMRQKSASLLASTGDDRTYVRWRVMKDPEIPNEDKQTLLSALAGLSGSQTSELADLLRTAVGAGIGALVAKFLMRSGIGGMLLGGLLGGFVGSSLGRSQRKDTDAYGNAYLF